MKRNSIVAAFLGLCSLLVPGPADAQPKWNFNFTPDVDVELTQSDDETEAGVTANRLRDEWTYVLGASVTVKNIATALASIDQTTRASGIELSAGTTYDPEWKKYAGYFWANLSVEAALGKYNWVDLNEMAGMPSILQRTPHSAIETSWEASLQGGWLTQVNGLGTLTLQALCQWEREYEDAETVQYVAEGGATIVDEDGATLEGPIPGAQRTFSDRLAAPRSKSLSTLAIGASVFPATWDVVGLSGGVYILDQAAEPLKPFAPWRWEAALIILPNGGGAGAQSGTSLQVGITRQQGDADASLALFVSLRSGFYHTRPFRE
jgi:hypothetical protein